MSEESTTRAAAEDAVSSERLGGRVKALRRDAGLTLDELAERAGVSRAMLSKLERGEKNPTLVVAARVAEGLGVTLTQLIETQERGAVVVIPRGARRVMRDPRTGFERQAISPAATGSSVELVYNVVPEGSTSGEFPPHRKGVEEHVVVERGRLRAVLGGEEYVLEAGDAVYFEADAPHRFDNAGDGECGYYLVIHIGGS
jgi:transcriptional regulator with XRE-family HTH domain